MQSRPSEDDVFDNDEDTPPPREFKLHMAKKFRDMGLSRGDIKELLEFIK
jgi:hypothetical protein